MLNINYHILNWQTYASPGGGEIHVKKIIDSIRKCNFRAFLNPSYSRENNNTIVHFFGKPEHHTLTAAEVLKSSKIPFVITPILYPLSGIRTHIHRTLTYLPFNRFNYRKNFFSLAEKIVANTTHEAKMYEKIYKVNSQKIEIIPTGADFNPVSSDYFKNKFGISDFILMVGRVTPLKQQLQIMRILLNTNYTLVLIGPPDMNHPDYLAEINSLIDKRPDWLWIKGLPNESILLKSAYSASKLHILNSKTDVAPLVCIEALANNTLSLSTNHKTVESMLSNCGYYYKSNDEIIVKINAIYSMTSTEYNSHVRHNFQYACDKFSWENIGYKHANLYNKIFQR